MKTFFFYRKIILIMGAACSSNLVTVTKSEELVSFLGSISNPDQLSFTDIDNVWQLAKQESSKTTRKREVAMQRTGWKTIRIFVSSTFRDFNAEREILVKKVFPDLRVWCQSRRLNLVECDLRWGVPKDSTTEMTLRTCLGEIDRCFQENIFPFFINMTSQRIGWIPLGEQLPSNLKREYRWIEGLSVTEMEIMHGAYRIDNPNALFLIRDPSFLNTVPEDFQHFFIDECDIASYKLEMLKNCIAEKFFEKSSVVQYKCEYAGVDPSTGIPQFKGLDNFATAVQTFFQERISATYPLVDVKLESPMEESKGQHESFMKMCSERVVGREELICELIEKYIKIKQADGPIVIYGGPGLGKTSIMAALADCCSQMAITNKLPKPNNSSRWRIFHHFVGAVAGSTDQLSMLNRLLLELKALDADEKPPTALEDALSLVRAALSNPRSKACIVVVDAVNQFDDFRGSAAPLSWLPSKISPNIRVFISMTPESAQFHNLQKSQQQCSYLQLQPLDRSTKEQMVVSHLARYNKRLDPGQLELLLNKQSSDNPMWLSLATEELRVFGSFRELTNKIRTLPDGLAELEADILGRFERESDGPRLIATLCLLECSVHGLLESELLELLATDDLLPDEMKEKITSHEVLDLENSDEQDEQPALGMVREKTYFEPIRKQERLTASKWADIFRVLRPFMRPFGASGEGRLDFYHRSLSKAVRSRYLFKTVTTKNGVSKHVRNEGVTYFFHKRLADYFNEDNNNLDRRIEEYPTHAYRCKDLEGLKRFLANWEVFNMLFSDSFSRQLIHNWELVFFMSTTSGGVQEATKHTMFKHLEDCYMEMLQPEIESFLSITDTAAKKSTIRKIEKVCRLLVQSGRYEKASELLDTLMTFLHPQIKPMTVDDTSDFSERDFDNFGSFLSKDEAIQLANLLHLKASVMDEEMNQVHYRNPSLIPKTALIIDSFERVISLLKRFAPNHLLVGASLNRLSFYYSDLSKYFGKHYGLNPNYCDEMGLEKIEEAIKFYSGMDGQELCLADCFITRGVAVSYPADPEKLEYYLKGVNLTLENAGPFHPKLDRAYLNVNLTIFN